MSKVESEISKRCSHYIGWLLGRHENYIGLGFCSHTRTALAARFLWRSEAAPRRSLKWSVTYRRGACSHYNGQLLHRRENHIGLGFCSHIKTVVAARFLYIRDFKIQGRGRQRESKKNTKGLISKTTTSHVHHTFLYISFSFLHDYDVKMSNFAFYGGRKQATTKFYFSFWAWTWSLEIQLQEGSHTIDKVSG